MKAKSFLSQSIKRGTNPIYQTLSLMSVCFLPILSSGTSISKQAASKFGLKVNPGAGIRNQARSTTWQ
jgi:hypothetical protein